MEVRSIKKEKMKEFLDDFHENSKKWYKKTKKKLKVYSEGFLQKKLKVKNSGNMITLKPTKSKDVSYGYKMMEDYSVY